MSDKIALMLAGEVWQLVTSPAVSVGQSQRAMGKTWLMVPILKFKMAVIGQRKKNCHEFFQLHYF